MVVLAYGALVVAGGWALVLTWVDPWVLASVGGGVVSLLATALVAAPTHSRLAAGKDAVLVRRLLVADRVRAAGAVVCLAGAAGAALA